MTKDKDDHRKIIDVKSDLPDLSIAPGLSGVQYPVCTGTAYPSLLVEMDSIDDLDVVVDDGAGDLGGGRHGDVLLAVSSHLCHYSRHY